MFDAVVGQERVKERFAALLASWGAGSGGLHHAYLFVGPAGVGKRTFAEELAALIVARGQDDAYRRAVKGVHPDVNLIEREGDVIRYEQVKQLVAELSRKPFLAAERVWVIDEADKLHPAAANKLLKSLEEPPAHVVFLLVSSEPDRLLPTIVSRCEAVPFVPVSRADLLADLATRHGLTGPRAEAIANLAGGSVGEACLLAEDAAGEDRRAALVGLVLDAVSGRPAAIAATKLISDQLEAVKAENEQRLASAITLMKASNVDKKDVEWHEKRLKQTAKRDTDRESRRIAFAAADTIASVLRDLWVASLGDTGVVLNCDRAPDITAAAAGLPAGGFAGALAAAQATRKDLALNVDRELALLALFCRLEEVSAS